jgi:putative transposase
VSRSGYHAWRRRTPSQRQLRSEQLLGVIRELHRTGMGNYGSPRMTRALRARGYLCSENRVARIMSENGVRARTVRLFRKKRHRGEYYRAAGNLLRGQPPPTAMDRVWVADLTHIRTPEGWLFLVAFMDLYSRRIVGWSTGQVRDTALAMDTFIQAWRDRGSPDGLTVHTDQGVEFLNNEFKQALHHRGVTQSTSRRGRCHDNAHMESFFHSLKNEALKLERIASRADATDRIAHFIDGFYNEVRLHSSLGFRSPTSYEALI